MSHFSVTHSASHKPKRGINTGQKMNKDNLYTGTSNKLLEICVEYAKGNNFLFSPKKCVFMSKSKPQIPITMGKTALERVPNFCYLGIYFDFKGFDRKTQVKALCTKALKSEKFFKSLGMHGNGWHLYSIIGVFKSFLLYYLVFLLYFF
jgi:hypothetical protein